MKTYHQLSVIIFIILLFIDIQTEAQYIIAGQHNSKNYYYDISPDSVLNSNAHDNITLVYYLDIDGDSSSDFKIISHCGCAAIGTSSIYTNISSLKSSCKVAFSQSDTCSFAKSVHPMAYPFNNGDTISSTGKWKWVDTVYFTYSLFVTNYGSCSGSVNIYDSYYIGFRLMQSSDTLFGWLNMQTPGSTIITLKEYACNKFIDGFNENIKGINPISIYPNPANERLFVDLGDVSGKAEVAIADIMGRIVYSSAVRQGDESRVEIDTRRFPAGIYFIRFSDRNASAGAKFIIARRGND